VLLLEIVIVMELVNVNLDSGEYLVNVFNVMDTMEKYVVVMVLVNVMETVLVILIINLLLFFTKNANVVLLVLIVVVDMEHVIVVHAN